ncbi:hypothetical protein D3C76_1285450 [compost metagenome]
MHRRVGHRPQAGVTCQALLDFLCGFPAAGQQALMQYFGPDIDQHRQQVWVALARLGQISPRAIHQHCPARRQPLVDLPWNTVIQAIGPPVHGKRTLRTQCFELFGRYPMGGFALGFGRTGDDATGDFHPGGCQQLT